MARTLDVYLHNKLVGHLIQDDLGQMEFYYLAGWIENPNAIPLSQSLPLRKERFKRIECRGFFAGLLPEGESRKIIARNKGVSYKNDYAMLEQIGGECAGAVTFVPTGEPLPKTNYGYRKLSNEELATIIRELPCRPLMAGDEGVRLSLAGVQEKIAVHVQGENISLPLGGAPSTHILKPDISSDYVGMVFNEAVCMKLADKIGLPTAHVEICQVEGIHYLMVERYDRKTVGASRDPVGGYVWTNFTTKRLHQEDFCQALAVPPDMKYEREDGPTLKQCFDLVREISYIPAKDLQFLLDGVILNTLIGNNDAHSKNFSLLYDERTFDEENFDEERLLDSQARLAPFYDLVSTVYYKNLSPKMAMKVGGEYRSEKLLPRHFERLAEEAGLAKKMVVKRVLELAEIVKEKTNHIEIDHDVARKIIALIKKRCEELGNRFKT